MHSRPSIIALLLLFLSLLASSGKAEDLKTVFGVERQPLVAATERLVEALEFLGSPLPPQVVVEIIVNGEVHSTREVTADGELRSLSVPVNLKQSSWVAVRILPSVHTNPIFVHIDNQPIRANARSAQWCIDAVKTCWKSKQPMIREEERREAKAAYDQAEAIYRQILGESKD